MFEFLVKKLYFSKLEARLMSEPAMGHNKVLVDTLTTLSEEHMLRSWSIYHEQNGCISIKIKFDNIGDSVNRESMTCKRKTASQAARDRRRSDQWNSRKTTPLQHPGPLRHLLPDRSTTATKSPEEQTGLCEPMSFGMQTRSKSRDIGSIEVLRRDEFTCEDISDNVEFLHTPLDPLAKPFHRDTDIVSPDIVHIITPCRYTTKERFDVPEAIEPITSPLSLNIVDTLSDDLDTSDTSTCSMTSTVSCETSCANCGKYWCGYGGGSRIKMNPGMDCIHANNVILQYVRCAWKMVDIRVTECISSLI